MMNRRVTAGWYFGGCAALWAHRRSGGACSFLFWFNGLLRSAPEHRFLFLHCWANICFISLSLSNSTTARRFWRGHLFICQNALSACLLCLWTEVYRTLKTRAEGRAEEWSSGPDAVPIDPLCPWSLQIFSQTPVFNTCHEHQVKCYSVFVMTELILILWPLTLMEMLSNKVGPHSFKKDFSATNLFEMKSCIKELPE